MKIVLVVMLASAGLIGCSREARSAGSDSEAVQQRAIEAQTARRRTGAELQDRALNRVVRAVYLCDNGERLTVDFDNPRQMATVRNSHGEAVDLFQQRAADGLWYLAGSTELRGKGILASWTADGRAETQCRAID